MMYHFCTCFDNNYLIYGYTLYRSLKNTVADFTLYIVCLDEQVYRNLKQLDLPNVRLIPLSDIESDDPEYAATSGNRSRVEYIFTLSPVMPLYILKKHPEIDILAYMDSDLFFFSSPEKLYHEMGNRSLLIFEHDFYPREAENAKDFGRFNMGFQLYRNNAQGIACLQHWRRECLAWCYDRPENGKFADQKYLEEWPVFFDAVIASNHSGGGLAPWNCGKHQFDFSEKKPLVDGNPVIFFHYQGCKILKHNMMLSASPPYYLYIPNSVANFFYSTYFNAMKVARSELEKALHGEPLQLVYLFKREKTNDDSPAEKSVIKHYLSSFIFHFPMLMNGRLTYKGHRIAPVISHLFYFRKYSR